MREKYLKRYNQDFLARERTLSEIAEKITYTRVPVKNIMLILAELDKAVLVLKNNLAPKLFNHLKLTELEIKQTNTDTKNGTYDYKNHSVIIYVPPTDILLEDTQVDCFMYYLLHELGHAFDDKILKGYQQERKALLQNLKRGTHGKDLTREIGELREFEPDNKEEIAYYKYHYKNEELIADAFATLNIKVYNQEYNLRYHKVYYTPEDLKPLKQLAQSLNSKH